MTMESTTQALLLIQEMLNDPVGFQDRGRGNELLRCYFSGASLDSIRPLLCHHLAVVREISMFVVAELGVEGWPLLDAVTTLVDDSDPHVAWDAMESVLLCSTGRFVDRFVFVVKQLENTSPALKRLAMRLMSKASVLQISGAMSRCGELGSAAAIHAKGLRLLIDQASGNSVAAREVHDMLNSGNELISVYGGVLAARTMDTCRDNIEYATSVTNSTVREFALDMISTRHANRDV